ncbi:MAG TPA: CDP-alcohol phosphatidyltransferase family protein [Planctomycetota bacterium]|nr:CDP-alcohol phosphatidyltransferase family protein [Planctomycetota bacterium]
MKFKLSWPNRITFFRLLLIPGFVLAAVMAWEGEPVYRWVALGLLLVVSGGDMLDGYLARKLHARSRLGAMLDPLTDKILMTSGYIVLASSFWPEPRMPVWVSVIVISRDVFIGLFYFSLVALAGGFKMITPSLVGKGTTLFQMSTLVGVLAAPLLAGALGETGMGYLLSGLFLFTAYMTLVSGIDYLYAARTALHHPDRVALIQSDVKGE